MQESRKKLGSWKQAQDQIRTILQGINADPQLALAAAANPLFALEELGYEINPDARPEFVDRIRFGREKFERMAALREAVFKHAGRRFNLDSEEELHQVLFEELKLQIPKVKAPDQYKVGHQLACVPITAPLPPQVGWGKKVDDPLEALRAAHPVMEPLLEYRRLEASEPRLSSRETYEDIRQGKRRFPVVRVQGILKAQK